MGNVRVSVDTAEVDTPRGKRDSAAMGVNACPNADAVGRDRPR